MDIEQILFGNKGTHSSRSNIGVTQNSSIILCSWRCDLHEIYHRSVDTICGLTSCHQDPLIQKPGIGHNQGQLAYKGCNPPRNFEKRKYLFK